jgi:ureidoacrylate peracid hydrolase
VLEAFVRPEDCVHVVVDMQNDFTHPDGALSRMGLDVSASDRAVNRLVGFLDATRAAGIPTVFIRQVSGPKVNDPARRYLLARKGSWSGQQDHAEPAVCVDDTWGARIDGRLQVLPDDTIVVKHRYSAFYQTDLELILRSLGRRSLIVSGTALNACVETTIRDAYMRGYFVAVPRETVGWSRQEFAEHSFLSIDTYFGEVCSVPDLVNLWGSRTQVTAR